MKTQPWDRELSRSDKIIVCAAIRRFVAPEAPEPYPNRLAKTYHKSIAVECLGRAMSRVRSGAFEDVKRILRRLRSI